MMASAVLTPLTRALGLGAASPRGRPWAALAVCLLVPSKVQVPSPPVIGGSGSGELAPAQIEDVYGPLQVADLEEVAHNGSFYHRRLVLTRGVVRDLEPGRYLALDQAGARVMLIPLQDGTYEDYATMRGIDVDVTGVVRVLPSRQRSVSCRGVTVLESKCEDWPLPVLPDAEPQWPRVSLTVVKMMDRGTGGGRPARGGSRSAEEETVTGQFRGANLCRDLPAETRRDAADWVLLTPEGPVWVTGRRPAGRGFTLDPAYRGDTSRWLEVAGKVQVVGGVRYLKAGKVAMIARPKEAEPAPCPP
jgi:hypothetical protein